jgi:hypothetical protein
MKVKIGGAAKNCRISVSGLLNPGQYKSPHPIFLFKDLSGSPSGVRLDSIEFAVQEKMGFNLWWIMEDKTHEVVLPLESRGYFDFEKVDSWHSPPGAVGMALSAFKITEQGMSFLIMLDLVKQL